MILARFAPKDPLHAAARSFFSTEKAERIISPISLVEINAVLSRENITFDTPEFIAKETGVRRIRALSEYFIKFLGLRMESLPLTARVRVAGSTVNIPLEYSEALKRAGELRLKTLDLLHLAYAGLVSNLRTKIDNFVTTDSDILDRGLVIEQQFGFKVAHPKDATG